MRAYLIRRLLLIIPTLFILSIIVFLSVRFIPGDIVDAMAAQMERYQTATIDREAVERMLGLDVPVYVQYGRWIGVLPTPDWVTGESHFNGLLQGNLGHSMIRGKVAVDELIIGRLPVTIELGVLAIVIGLVIALPVGIYSAIRQDTAADYAGRTIAIIGLATPNFWLGNHGHDLPGQSGGVGRTAAGADCLSPKTRSAISAMFVLPSLIRGNGVGCKPPCV